MLEAAAKSAEFPSSSLGTSDIISSVKMDMDDASQENSEAEIVVPTNPDTDDSSDEDDESGDEQSDNKLSIAVSSPSPTAKLADSCSPFKCDVCGKEFSARQPWQRHAMVHTGEKPYACTTCPARFRCTSHLKRHMRLHTGERPCQCPLCPKAYTDNPNLLRHMTIVHGCRAYECEMCSSAFALERELRAHLVDAHDVQLLPVSSTVRTIAKLHSPHSTEDGHVVLPPAPARVLSRRLYRTRDITPGRSVDSTLATTATITTPTPSSAASSSTAGVQDVPTGGAPVPNGTPGVIPVRRGRGRPKGSKNHPRPPLLSALQVPSMPAAHKPTMAYGTDDQLAKRARVVPTETVTGMWNADPSAVGNVPPLLLATDPASTDVVDPKSAAAAAAANPWMAFYQNPLLAMQAQLMQAQLAQVQWAYMAQMAQLARWAQQGGPSVSESSPAVVPTTPVAPVSAPAPMSGPATSTDSPTVSIEESMPESVPAVASPELVANIETPVVKTEDVSCAMAATVSECPQ